MKLNKSHKNKIWALVNKLAVSTTYKRNFYFALLKVFDEKVRSLPQHRLYWTFCEYMAGAMPEPILNMLGLKNMNSEMIHNMLKCKFEVTSTAFNNMDESDFTAYFQECVKWVASYILRCDIKDLKEFINEGEV